ncbi:diguanylate cyclase [Fusibacter paucivorans]|uniref:Diguanylate cyclase n=1 Tax=Fusibacter paucivorans TaxID=76009 RepID=A0ABS5PVK9_9FIRM|nr:HD domain-containing phosphohydrolase [Fusibacter paucivorans]MBS7528751.1 diguanylate cyclase [Fusibacter paucivorans]
MKKSNKMANKKSLNQLNRLVVLIIPLVVGIGLMLAETFYEVSAGQKREALGIAQYELQIKNRMKEEVTKAVQIADFYYIHNSRALSREALQLEIVAILEQLQSEDVGYFFIADYQGNNMLGPSKGNNFYDIEDKNGLKVVQELIKKAKEGGGYVTYIMPPIDSVEQVPKISYVMPFEPFDWYIGAGVNLSEIDTIKAQISREIHRKNLKTIAITCAMIVSLMVLFWLINNRFYKGIKREIHMINDYLDKSTVEQATLDIDLLHYEEMSQIGQYTVSLITKRNEDQADLETFNTSLEEEISEHAATIEMLNNSRRRIESIVSALPDIIFIMDSNGTIVDSEAGGKQWMGKAGEDYANSSVYEALPSSVAKSCVAAIQETLKSKGMFTYEFSMEEGEGRTYYEVRITPYQKDQVVAIIRNVTDAKQFQLTNEYLSYHDQLTGLYNRRYFEEALIRLDNALYMPIALAMVDVNGLKMVNDAFGHQTGDQVLRLISKAILAQCTMPDGFVARIGGDEFVIVCPNTNEQEMEKLTNDIYDAVSQIREELSVVSVSVGWDIKKQLEQSITDIFNKAEVIMYRKKLTESQSIRHQAVQAILKTLNEKNEREKIHSERVSIISRMIGEAMNMNYSVIKEIETAGLLHDIGKIVIDQDILNKTGKLNEEEYEKIKKHPESSYQILKSIDSYASLADDVLSHHERWDGCGYPRRLKGEEIPFIARIITVADAYEAMTADRSYRRSMTKEAALAELKAHAGKQFDPTVVNAFERDVFDKL